MTQAFLPVMIKNKNGHIVSICSMAGTDYIFMFLILEKFIKKN